MKKHTIQALATVVVACGFAMAARAQIGTGWTPYTTTFKIDLAGSGTYSSSGGVQTFKITSSTTSGVQRAEIRLYDDFSTGQHQFQGMCKVVSLGGTHISLKQTFSAAPGGAWFLLGLSSTSGGSLYDVGDGGAGTFATGVVGKTFQVNTVNNMTTATQYLYINGALKETRSQAGHTAFYDKYGAYRNLSGHGPVTIQWTSVKLFKK